MNDAPLIHRETRRRQMKSLTSKIKKLVVFLVVVAGILLLLSKFSKQASQADAQTAKAVASASRDDSISAAAPDSTASRMSTEETNSPETSFSESAPPSKRRASKSTVDAIKIQLSKSAGTLRTYSGVLKPAQSSNLGFQRTGRVVDIRVDLGDRVEKNQILAILDRRSLEADKLMLQAELDAAESKLRELRAGPRQQSIDSAKATLAEYKSMLQLSEITANRSQRLLQSNAGSRQKFDDARLQYAANKSRYQSQLHVVAELEAGTRVEKIQSQQAVVDKLKASIQGVDVKLDESILKAPFNGIVSNRFVDLGASVSPATNVLLIVDTSNPEAWIGVPSRVTSMLKAGGTYPIQLGGHVVDSKLRAVLPELDPVTRTQTAVFEIPDSGSEQMFRFGQVVRLDYRQQTGVEGFWVPKSSLTHGVRGLWSVFALLPKSGVDTDSRLHALERRDVEVIQIESDRVLVRGTIELGELIVANGVQKLVGGQTVSVRKLLSQAE